MKPDEREIQQRMDRFKAACSDSGVRLTHQRLEVFREVAQAGDHPDAEAVYKRVRKRMPTISLDTIYRTLWLLNDLGLITTLGTPRERTRFDANLTRHHHFVCVHCGLTQDFYSEELDDIKLPPTAEILGQAEMTLVEVRGVCRECSSNNSKPINPKNRRRNHGQEKETDQ